MDALSPSGRRHHPATAAASAAGDATDLPVFNALWIGDRLSSLHILCLLSAIRQGHQLRLFGYRRFPELPGEIEQADARMVLPEEAVTQHRRTGSHALFSDRFRFEMVARGFGAWIDTDQLILKPVRARDGFIAGWDNPRKCANVTVLLYPPDSGLSDELLWWWHNQDRIPPWLPRGTRARLAARRLIGLPIDSTVQPWASWGPDLFDYACRKHGLTDRISHMSRFTPVPYREKGQPFRADGNPEAFFTEETEGVHLFHQGLRGGTDGRNEFTGRKMIFEKGSFLWRMAEDLDLPRSLAWEL